MPHLRCLGGQRRLILGIPPPSRQRHVSERARQSDADAGRLRGDGAADLRKNVAVSRPLLVPRVRHVTIIAPGARIRAPGGERYFYLVAWPFQIALSGSGAPLCGRLVPELRYAGQLVGLSEAGIQRQQRQQPKRTSLSRSGLKLVMTIQ